MKSDKRKSSQNDCELSPEGGRDNIDAKLNVTQSPSVVKHKSKVSGLIELSYSSETDCNGNWWLQCPWCSSDRLNFNPRLWQFYCYSCEAGRGKNLSHLMAKLGIE